MLKENGSTSLRSEKNIFNLEYTAQPNDQPNNKIYSNIPIHWKFTFHTLFLGSYLKMYFSTNWGYKLRKSTNGKISLGIFNRENKSKNSIILLGFSRKQNLQDKSWHQLSMRYWLMQLQGWEIPQSVVCKLKAQEYQGSSLRRRM